jgi:hypothetical protein
LLFSHPADFTPVCTTELGRIAVHDHEFKKRGVKVIAHSCDKLKSHSDWVAVSHICWFEYPLQVYKVFACSGHMFMHRPAYENILFCKLFYW